MGVGIDRWLASLDMTPSRTLGSYIVSKDIFDFHNNLLPLQSAYNASAEVQAIDEESEGGRPTVEEEGGVISEEGERTRDEETNKR